jgi:ubiquinone/menaquinone biosynthesis C-methylase UbiE
MEVKQYLDDNFKNWYIKSKKVLSYLENKIEEIIDNKDFTTIILDQKIKRNVDGCKYETNAKLNITKTKKGYWVTEGY